MSYSEFSLDKAVKTFKLTTSEQVNLFAETAEIECSSILSQTLQYNVSLALAMNTEKARSELIIAPILLELRRQLQDKISLFSGTEFNIAPELGLNGICDFLISKSPEQLIIEAPVIALVEAKNDNIESGLAQCMAETIAAQLFNQQKGNEIKKVYGVVTTGSLWKFMQLEEQTISIDINEYFVGNPGKILGILKSFIE